MCIFSLANIENELKDKGMIKLVSEFFQIPLEIKDYVIK